MTIEDTVSKPFTKWMEVGGPHAPVVISSRVRLARNLAGFPFPHLQADESSRQVVDQVRRAVESPEAKQAAGQLDFTLLGDLSPLDRQVLVEKHLISPQHATDEGPVRGLALSEDEGVSIMVNEEDHLRIQVLFPALRLNEAWELASKVDDALEAGLNYSFDEQYGYLTCCPTNVGTGLRASVMMHLPALTITNQAGRMFMALSKLGFVVRGLYGEGTEARGNLFQISNQVTLGPSEEEIIGNLMAVSRQVIEQEENGRQELHKEGLVQVEDMVFRSYGILTCARIINSDEAMAHLSNIRLGVDLGILPAVRPLCLNELLVSTRPGFLQRQAGQEMDPLTRDRKRAEIIREALGNSAAAAGKKGS